MDSHQLQFLLDARQRAKKLVEALRDQQAEIDAKPPDLPPEQLADGRQAMQNAIASAQRMLQALEDALGTDPGTMN